MPEDKAKIIIKSGGFSIGFELDMDSPLFKEIVAEGLSILELADRQLKLPMARAYREAEIENKTEPKRSNEPFGFTNCLGDREPEPVPELLCKQPGCPEYAVKGEVYCGEHWYQNVDAKRPRARSRKPKQGTEDEKPLDR